MQKVEQHIIKDERFKDWCIKAKNLKSGVYKITNLVTGDFYIGSTFDFLNRQRQHLHCVRKGKHTNKHLQSAFKKYGEEMFQFTILVVCPVKYCVKLEQWFIDTLNPKYNKCPIAGSNFGLKYKRTEEHRKNHSAALMGRIVTAQTRDKISKANKGKKHTPERVENNSKSFKKAMAKFKGIKRSEAICEKIRNTKRSRGVTKHQLESRSKKVIDTLTGEIYDSAKILAQIKNINYENLIRKLRGARNNNTSFLYMGDGIIKHNSIMRCLVHPIKINHFDKQKTIKLHDLI